MHLIITQKYASWSSQSLWQTLTNAREEEGAQRNAGVLRAVDENPNVSARGRKGLCDEAALSLLHLTDVRGIRDFAKGSWS